MKIKRLLYILPILLIFTSCKSDSAIITSKSVAKKKGVYDPTVLLSNRIAVAKTDNSNSCSKLITKNKTSINKNIISSKPKAVKKNKATRAILKDSEIENDYAINNEDVSYLRKQLINAAMEYSGVRYRIGGTSNSGMDCSGLIVTTFNMFDIKLPRTSFDLSKKGTKLNKSEIKKGDLVFFRINSRKKRINHVGLVVEVDDDEIKFIHASVQNGVIISSTKEAYYKKSFVQANRVLD